MRSGKMIEVNWWINGCKGYFKNEHVINWKKQNKKTNKQTKKQNLYTNREKLVSWLFSKCSLDYLRYKCHKYEAPSGVSVNKK